MNFISSLNNAEMNDRTSKLSVITAISRYVAILQKVAYTIIALPPTQVTVETLFSLLRINRSDLRTLIESTYPRQFYFFAQMTFV